MHMFSQIYSNNKRDKIETKDTFVKVNVAPTREDVIKSFIIIWLCAKRRLTDAPTQKVKLINKKQVKRMEE